MYDAIISFANKITGNSKEGLFVRDLKNKWEQAYRTENNNLNNQELFSIKTDGNGNKYVEVDTDQHIFDWKSIKEQNKIAKQYILANFRESGLAIENDSINVNRKSAEKYTTPNAQLTNESKNAKIKATTELDNLLSISQYKNHLPDDGRHSFAKDGWDYYETEFKLGDNAFIGLINIGKNGDNKTFYDITNIKKTTLSNKVEDSTARLNELSIDNNIPQSNTNVKSDTSSCSLKS